MLIITGSSWKVLVMEAKLVSVYEGLFGDHQNGLAVLLVQQ